MSERKVRYVVLKCCRDMVRMNATGNPVHIVWERVAALDSAEEARDLAGLLFGDRSVFVVTVSEEEYWEGR